MNVDDLLDRFDGVQKMGENWRARCPCCGGTSRKVSIRSGDNGKLLIHCFQGCTVSDVVEAAGLTMAELFPERIQPSNPIERRERAGQMRQQADMAAWGAALEVLSLEAKVVEIAAGDLLAGKELNLPDTQRLRQAAERICHARQHLRPINVRLMTADIAKTREAMKSASILAFKGSAA